MRKVLEEARKAKKKKKRFKIATIDEDFDKL